MQTKHVQAGLEEERCTRGKREDNGCTLGGQQIQIMGGD
jgi:hypothetical protein